MAYRDDHEALAARNVALERELIAARQELEQARRLSSLPLLDRIRVASPCKASWQSMRGGQRVRFCEQCQKNVYNLSGMTREEAEELVRGRGGTACVRFYRRADDTILTADCPVGLRRLRFRRAVLAAVGAGILTASAFGYLTARQMGHTTPPAFQTKPAPIQRKAVGPPKHENTSDDGSTMGALGSTPF